MNPSDLQQALQRLQNGTDTSADLEAVRAALQANLITLAPAARAVTVGGNTEGTVIVTGDGNTVQVLHGAAADQQPQQKQGHTHKRDTPARQERSYARSAWIVEPSMLCDTPWCAGWRHSAAMGYIWERRGYCPLCLAF